MPRRAKGGDNDPVDLALTLLAVAVASLLVHGIASRLGALAPLLLLAALAGAAPPAEAADVFVGAVTGLAAFADPARVEPLLMAELGTRAADCVAQAVRRAVGL